MKISFFRQKSLFISLKLEIIILNLRLLIVSIQLGNLILYIVIKLTTNNAEY